MTSSTGSDPDDDSICAAVDRLEAAGLGLEYGMVRLGRTSVQGVCAGEALRDAVAGGLDSLAIRVELIGSASIVGLLAKPIADLAVAVGDLADLDAVGRRLERRAWIYRGDAGGEGGHVFVLDVRPQVRVSNLHVVGADDWQFERWIRLRDLLRSSPTARARYELVKRELAAAHPGDRPAYTAGKNDVVAELLRQVE